MKNFRFKNIFHKITFESLRKNRTRTCVTIIGIILSTALITAITTFISSLSNSMIEFKISESGNWHGAVLGVELNDTTLIDQDDELKMYFHLYNQGYAQLESKNNVSKQYLNIQAADQDFLSNMVVKVTSGRLPQNSSEILLPEDLLRIEKDTYALNQKLELELGKRMMEDKEMKSQANQLADGEGNASKESLSMERTKEYTVVGFYEKPAYQDYSAPGYSLLTMYDHNESYDSCDVYYRLKTPGHINQFNQRYSKQYLLKTNNQLLQLMGTSKYSSFVGVVYGLAAIVIVLVMAGSVLLIYNSFAISVNERTKQFGLLSSIGATRVQLRQSVLFESMFVSLIGIPIGIIIGIAGIAITLWGIRGNLNRMAVSIVSIGKMNLHISWLAILVAVLVAIITVLVSAFIPMIRVSKISALDAIRQIKDINIKGKKIKTSKLFYKVFGFEGMLAKKNFKRSRKKYRTTVFSLVVSIVLFISASSLSGYLIKTVEGMYQLDEYQITFGGRYEFDDPIFRQLSEIDGVKKMGISSQKNATLNVTNQMLSDAFIKNNNDKEQQMNIELYIIDDQSYLEYLKENHFSQQEYFNTENPKLIGSAKKRLRNKESGKVTDYDVFKNQPTTFNLNLTDHGIYEKLLKEYEDELSKIDYNDKEQGSRGDEIYEKINEQSKVSLPVQVGCFTEDFPFAVSSYNRFQSVYLFCAESMYPALKQNVDFGDKFTTAYFDTTDHSKVSESIKNILKDKGIAESMVEDIATDYESQQSMIFIIKVFSYGFIIMLSLIAMANVFNTVSTNMILRRREFAMLKSVGLTNNGFNHMMYFECLLYGSKSLLFGIPISLGFTYWVFKEINGIFEIAYAVPVTAIIIAFCSVFIVVLITMWYSKCKINQLNMIDCIKNENV